MASSLSAAIKERVLAIVREQFQIELEEFSSEIPPRTELGDLAFPVAFAAALAALPLPLAPAHLPGDRLSFALELSPYLGIALATQVVIGAFALARATRELVLGTILVGLVAVTVPALGAWAIVGEPGATLLPSPGIVMVTPVTAAVAACQAWFAALVLAVVLVRRRASDVTR